MTADETGNGYAPSPDSINMDSGVGYELTGQDIVQNLSSYRSRPSPLFSSYPCGRLAQDRR